jgi:hypothetical protein
MLPVRDEETEALAAGATAPQAPLPALNVEDKDGSAADVANANADKP